MASRTREQPPSPPPRPNDNRAIWVGRVLFVLSLAALAVAFSVLANYSITNSERELAETQFESTADRALNEVVSLTTAARWSLATLASMIATMLPDASEWPFVAVPNYETIANNMLSTSKGDSVSFFPIVTPEQLSDWEDFAYDYYERVRNPPFPNGTAVSSFGKGVWAIDPDSDAPDKRFHDTTGKTEWNNTWDILTPIFHTSEGADPILMFNRHYEPTRGRALESMIRCSQDRLASATNNGSYPLHSEEYSCGVLTELVTLLRDGRGAGAIMMQPIYPMNNMTQLTGGIAERLAWDKILKNIFADEISGIDCILEVGDEAFTYTIVDGVAITVGSGDLHDRSYDRFRRMAVLNGHDMFTEDSPVYTLSLYPNDEFYGVYRTENTKISTGIVVASILATSALFFLYDFFVRREFRTRDRLLKHRRQFMRFVSHEVRTPLNAVCMGLNVLQTEIAGTLGYKSGEDLETMVEEATKSVADNPGQKLHLDWFSLLCVIQTSANNAVDVLSDFLNYDKIANGELQLELTAIRMRQLIEQTTREFLLPAKEREVEFVVDLTERGGNDDSVVTAATSVEQGKDAHHARLMVVGDTVRLQQVMRNLFSNALKFTPAGGRVHVVTSCCLSTQKEGAEPLQSFELKNGKTVRYRSAGELQLSVSDSGAGMSKDQLERLFREGVQFNVNELQGGKGSGLGLYISKGIVSQHGGNLEATSEGIGKGTTFCMTLPLYRVPQATESELLKRVLVKTNSPPEVKPSSSMRVLVVDDIPTNRKLLGRLLSNRGHAYDQAEDGKVAVEMVTATIQAGNSYDCVLMDYEMPVMDGPTAAKEIRSMGSNVLIVGVTGNLLPEDVKHFEECGANAVLPKPFKIYDLEELWAEYLMDPSQNTC